MFVCAGVCVCLGVCVWILQALLTFSLLIVTLLQNYIYIYKIYLT